MAALLDEPGGAGLENDWIAQATDATEEALAIARSTGYRSPWLADLVRYGAEIYRVCQPHFLAGFIREWATGDGPLAGDEALKRQMACELLLAKADSEQRVRTRPHETEFVLREMKTLASLQIAQMELAAPAL